MNKKAESEKRSKSINIRVTEAEHKGIVKKARSSKNPNIPLGRWCYNEIMNKKTVIIPEANRELWAYLGKVSGGLTTIAKFAMTGKHVKVNTEMLETLRTEVSQLRKLLIGVKE